MAAHLASKHCPTHIKVGYTIILIIICVLLCVSLIMVLAINFLVGIILFVIGVFLPVPSLTYLLNARSATLTLTKTGKIEETGNVLK
jgi:hypothetical protein